jgi:hypothetical protein
MTSLERAMAAANERKMAALSDDDSEGVVFAEGEFQDRAVFSGFDIQYGELIGTSAAVANVYTQAAHGTGLRPLFISAWCDGLLTGLLLGCLPAESDPGVTDDTGTEGEYPESAGQCPVLVDGVPCGLNIIDQPCPIHGRK